MTKSNINKKVLQGMETKKRIRSTALKLFNEKGYENVSVDEIVLESNSSKGAFYTHFKSKAMLMDEDIRHLDILYLQYYNSELVDSNLSSLKKLRLFVSFSVDTMFSLAPISLLTMIFAHNISHSTELNIKMSPERNFYKILESIITDGHKSGEFNEVYTVSEIIKLIVIFSRGLNYTYAIKNGDFDYELPLSNMLDLIEYKIRIT